MARNRAYRRAQRARARKRAIHLTDHIHRLFRCDRYPEAAEWRLRYIRQVATDRKPCSCAGCGNPRRWYGDLTLQELRLDDLRESRYADHGIEEIE